MKIYCLIPVLDTMSWARFETILLMLPLISLMLSREDGMGGGGDMLQFIYKLGHFSKGIDHLECSAQFGTLGGFCKKISKTFFLKKNKWRRRKK